MHRSASYQVPPRSRPMKSGRFSIDSSYLSWLLLLLAAAVLGAGAWAATPVRTPVPREVLAFYYGWWATPQGSGEWRHWEGVDTRNQTTATTARYPQGGVYDSHDAKTVERQMQQMHAAGLTGVVASWWGRDSFDDRSLDLLMRIAPRHALKVSAYYETVPGAESGATPDAKVDAAFADLYYLATRHGTERAWLKVGDRPVIFVFRRAVAQLGLDGWWVVNQRLRRLSPAPILIADVDLDSPTGPVTSAFGGVHAYNNADRTAGKTAAAIDAWAGGAFPLWVQRWDARITSLTIIPGFGNARAAGTAIANNMTERWGGATYQALADRAIDARPDWLLITSWNEWHEGTEIEPSIELGGQALHQTEAFARRFRSLPPRAVAIDAR